MATPHEVTAPVPRDVKPEASLVASRRPDTDFAIVIGVEHYRSIGPLRGTVSDAMAFYDWLWKRGGLDKRNVWLCVSAPSRVPRLSSHPTDPPSQQQIDDALDSILREACRLRGARRLYFYFAGHGAGTGGPDDDVALLLTSCSNTDRRALSTNRYSSALTSAGLFQEVAFFLDCCRSVSFPMIGLEPTLKEKCDMQFSTRQFAAYATEARRVAYEIAGPDGWRGIFTHYLVNVLHRASIAAWKLKHRLEREVPRIARDHKIEQCPLVRNEFLAESGFGGGGTPRLIERLGRLPVVGRWLDPDGWPVLELRFVRRQGRVALRDGKLRVVARHKTGTRPWRLRLPVGLYCLESRDGPPDRFSFWHNGPEVLHDV